MRKYVLTGLLSYLFTVNAAFAQADAVWIGDLNKIATADLAKQYADKPLVTKGIVTYTGPDLYGLPAINLSDKANGELYVLCVLPFSDFFKLADIKKDEQITVSGEYRHRHSDGFLVVKQCSVVDE